MTVKEWKKIVERLPDDLDVYIELIDLRHAKQQIESCIQNGGTDVVCVPKEVCLKNFETEDCFVAFRVVTDE